MNASQPVPASEPSPAPTNRIAALIAMGYMPILLGGFMITITMDERSWHEPSTYWGMVTGAALALAAAVVGWRIGHRK